MSRNVELTTGQPVPADHSHAQLRPDGQQLGYVVLTAEERAKGFIKPVRRSYLHGACGNITTMGTSIAETYARDPHFYSGTFCTYCSKHYPLDQFNWEPDGEPMDPDQQEAWAATVKQRRDALERQRAEKLERDERAELARLKAKYE